MMSMDKINNNFNQSDFDAVEFNNTLHPRIQVRPIYFKLGFSEKPRVFGRRAVLDRIIAATKALRLAYGFLIFGCLSSTLSATTPF
jgi:D-alanyl-D-alanine dipeptidase